MGVCCSWGTGKLRLPLGPGAPGRGEKCSGKLAFLSRLSTPSILRLPTPEPAGWLCLPQLALQFRPPSSSVPQFLKPLTSHSWNCGPRAADGAQEFGDICPTRLAPRTSCFSLAKFLCEKKPLQLPLDPVARARALLLSPEAALGDRVVALLQH